MSATESKKEFQGSIDIEVAGKPFRLDGEIGDKIAVGWREGEKELGTLNEMIKSASQAILGDDSLYTEFETFTTVTAPSIGLGGVIDALVNGLTIYATAFYIEAQNADDGTGTKKWSVTVAEVGFRGEFAPGTVALGPVELRGFGMLFGYQKNPVTGEVTSGAVYRSVPRGRVEAGQRAMLTGGAAS